MVQDYKALTGRQDNHPGHLILITPWGQLRFYQLQLNYNYIQFYHANTLYHAVTLTFDLLTLSFRSNGCDTFKLCTKSEQNRTIHG